MVGCVRILHLAVSITCLRLTLAPSHPGTVEFITDRLLHFLRGSTDPYLKSDLTSKICTISERFAPNNTWYVSTITELFKIAGDLVDPDVATNLMSLIAEGTGNEDDDEEADMVLRKQAVELYVSLLASPPNRMSRVLVETLAWVLGEYGYLSSAMSLDAIIDSMCKLLHSGNNARLGGGATSTRRLVLSAIMKMVAQFGSCPQCAAKIIDDYTLSEDPDAQRRCLEFQTIITTAPQLLGEVFPVDASLEDVDVDVNMSFLDGIVSVAVANGARPYSKPDDDDDDDDYLSSQTATGGAFKMTPYEKPSERAYGQGAMAGLGSSSMGPSATTAGVALPPGQAPGVNSPTSALQQPQQPTNPGQPQLTIRNSGANVWGKKPTAQAAPAAPPVAASPSVNSFSSPSPALAQPTYGGFGAQVQVRLNIIWQPNFLILSLIRFFALVNIASTVRIIGSSTCENSRATREGTDGRGPIWRHGGERCSSDCFDSAAACNRASAAATFSAVTGSTTNDFIRTSGSAASRSSPSSRNRFARLRFLWCVRACSNKFVRRYARPNAVDGRANNKWKCTRAPSACGRARATQG